MLSPQKIFCRSSEASYDWPGLATALRETGFQGAATIEQDIDPTISLAPARRREGEPRLSQIRRLLKRVAYQRRKR